MQSAVHEQIQKTSKKEESKRQFKRFVEGEKKLEWQLTEVTEIVIADFNPIYLKTFTLSSANFMQIEVKVEIYLSITGKQSTESRHATLLGETQFKVEDLSKVKLQTSAVNFQLRNFKSKGMDNTLMRRQSELTIRYEEVEQTAAIV